jgi:hypothetical protein
LILTGPGLLTCTTFFLATYGLWVTGFAGLRSLFERGALSLFEMSTSFLSYRAAP